MSLLVLMYHRARAGRHGNAPEMLDAHFGHLKTGAANVLPGEALAPDSLNVCLSFDDGYFDFYAVVFPLLLKHNLKALLAIPPAFVRERVGVGQSDRLAIETEEAFAHPDLGGFCTWPELAEMATSGHVTIAAHGNTHQRLDRPAANLRDEIDRPQATLRDRLGQAVDSFVFPFGRYSARALGQAQRSYRHLFRIGGATNRGWEQRLLYRVDADAMDRPGSVLAPSRLAGYRARYLWNRLRRR